MRKAASRRTRVERPARGRFASPYLPQVPGKWPDEDGLGGRMVFSGDYTMPDCQGDYSGFMTRRFRMAKAE
jgi:hypothetical protein